MALCFLCIRSFAVFMLTGYCLGTGRCEGCGRRTDLALCAAKAKVRAAKAKVQ